MTFVESILLGIVQALTEFLPVSSSGHLRLGREIFAANVEQTLLFDVLVHGGTLVAVFYVYADRIRELLSEAWKDLTSDDSSILTSEAISLITLIVIATIPTGIIGMLGQDWIASDVFDAGVVGGILMINGALLFTSRFFGERKNVEQASPLTYAGLTWWMALIVGVMQGIAILPGISRAGITIITAIALGANRERAAEFSFFLSIPAIAGAIVLELMLSGNEMTGGDVEVYAAGALAAALFGIFALRSLLTMLRRAQMHRFAWYCWVVGAFAIGWNYFSTYS
jgi:undecaprenyl-diphosphatase